jgi:membrane protease YdiL (CAAX protease family)
MTDTGAADRGVAEDPWLPPAARVDQPLTEPIAVPTAAQVVQPVAHEPVPVPTAGLPVVTPSGHPDAGWSLRDVLAAFGVILLITTAVQTVLQIGGISSVPSLSLTLALGFLPVWIGLAGTSWWAVRAHGTGSSARDLGLRFRWVDLAVGLGVGLGLRVIAALVASLVAGASGRQPTGNGTFAGGAVGDPLLIALLFLVVAILGPVIEEVFFRGLGLRSALASLQRRDVRRGRAPRDRRTTAVWLTSTLFMFLHFTEVTDVVSLIALAPTLLLAGLAFGWISMQFRRIGPAVVAHIVFNATALLPLAFS